MIEEELPDELENDLDDIELSVMNPSFTNIFGWS